MAGSTTPHSEQTNSVLLGQQQASGRPVRLGDDPERVEWRDCVGRKQPRSDPNGQLVLAPVVGVEVSPVASEVSIQVLARGLVVTAEKLKSSGGGDHAAQ